MKQEVEKWGGGLQKEVKADEGKITQRLFDKTSRNLILYLPKIMYNTLKCTYTDRHRHRHRHTCTHTYMCAHTQC